MELWPDDRCCVPKYSRDTCVSSVSSRGRNEITLVRDLIGRGLSGTADSKLGQRDSSTVHIVAPHLCHGKKVSQFSIILPTLTITKANPGMLLASRRLVGSCSTALVGLRRSTKVSTGVLRRYHPTLSPRLSV